MPTPGSPSGSGAISRPPLLKMLAILETGVAEIDTDHRDLIDRFNDLTAIAAREVPWRALHAAAHLLAQRCREHFEREEMILARSGFPRCKEHIREHRRFDARFSDLASRLAAPHAQSREHLTIVGGLRDLLVDLLVRHDLDYKSHLQHAIGRKKSFASSPGSLRNGKDMIGGDADAVGTMSRARSAMLPRDINSCQSVDDVMRRWPATISVFLRYRMACVGCAIGPFHTIEEVSAEYGLVASTFIGELRDAAAASAARL